MTDFIYRFRPAEALLGKFHELEKQEIYFAHPSELNDPLDGVKDVQWTGDAILWANLLNHYLLCLNQAAMLALAGRNDDEILNKISVFIAEDALPSDAAKSLYQLTKSLFFSQEDVARLPALLAARPTPIRRDELRMYLRVLHFQAVDSVLRTMEEGGLKQPRQKTESLAETSQAANNCRQMLESINQSHAERPELGELFGHVTESYFYQESLLRGLRDGAAATHGRAWQVLFSDFPSRYVSDLENLLYNQWFTACFVADPTNAAMWGNYGDMHQGVALKFRTIPVSGEPTLTLNQVTGSMQTRDGPVQLIRGDVSQIVREVQYQERFVAIDFFRSMGQLTGATSRFWHCDAAGKTSPLITAAKYESDEWREDYWKTLTSAITTKHKDWAHERECRIVLKAGLIDFSTQAARKLTYRFEDLEGIVFGMKTPAPQVGEILQIVREKCRKAGRTRFDFFRADYSAREGKMVLVPLSMLKIA